MRKSSSVSIFLISILFFSSILMNAQASNGDHHPLWKYEAGDALWHVDLSADGQYIAASTSAIDVSTNADVLLFHQNSSQPLWTFHSWNPFSPAVALSGDGQYLVTCGLRRSLLFGPDTNDPIWECGMDGQILEAAISADGRYFITALESAYFCDRLGSFPLDNYSLDHMATCTAMSDDGWYALVGTYAGTVYLFERFQSSPVWSYTLDDKVWQVACSNAADYIVANTGGSSRQLYLFNQTGLLWNHTCEDAIASVDISADGQYIVCGGHNNDILFFNRSGPVSLWNYSLSGGSNFQVALSSNGQYLAAGSEDNIYFFGTNSSVPLWGYRLKSSIIDLDISENGTFVAVTDQEGSLYYFHRTIVGSGIGVSSFPLIIYLIAICIIMRYTIKWSRNRDFFRSSIRNLNISKT